MQYLTSDELVFQTDVINVDDLIGMNSYDERKILLKISSMKKEDQTILLKIALQGALIGFGQKSYGEIKIGEKNVAVSDLLHKYNIKLNDQNAKLNPDDLSVRRLIRIFRYQISKFINDNDVESYLYKKYSNGKGKKNLIFPGAEHIVTNTLDAKNLIETYSKLDEVKETKFVLRIKTVLTARGIKFE